MSIGAVVAWLTLGQAKSIAKTHGVFVAYRAPLAKILSALTDHRCSKHCYNNVYIFKAILSNSAVLSSSKRSKAWYQGVECIRCPDWGLNPRSPGTAPGALTTELPGLGYHKLGCQSYHPNDPTWISMLVILGQA